MIPIAQPVIDDQEKEKIMEVLDSGILAEGETVKQFQKEFCSYIDISEGVATNNGTAALHAALLAAGIGEGDKVLTTPFTFIASSNALLYCGARPVYADIKQDTYNIDPQAMEEKLKEDPEIKALLIVHLYGQPCDMKEIMRLVEKYDLILIEDCAQAHGASYQGKKVGTFGQAGVFSFYPTKNMTTSEGGMVVSDDHNFIEKVRSLTRHGSSRKYHHEELGYNYRMTNLAAAIGLAQLKKLPDFNQKRRENADLLSEQLTRLTGLTVPQINEKKESVFHLYTVRVENRDDFVDYLQDRGVGCGIYYPRPVYSQPLYKKRGFGDHNLPVVEKACREVVSLPIHPALTQEQLTHIIEVVRDFFYN